MVICIDFTEVSHVVQVRAEGPGLGASALYLSLRPVTVGSRAYWVISTVQVEKF